MHLAEIYNMVKDKIDATERLIEHELGSDINIIPKMGEYITKGGGKRIRPALLYLSAGACGYDGEKDIRYGVVFEFVHTATLIHDDIIDNADMRRGKQVLNRKYGTTLSLLFGDHLFNTAMGMAIRDDDYRIVKLINKATEKMIGGEILQAERNYSPDLTLEEYMDLIERKTAYVFASAAQAGVILAERGEEMESRFFEYGMNLGMAFQVIDDYFDYATSSSVLGKPVGSDLHEGKITYPVFLLLERSPDLTRDIIEKTFRNRNVEKADMNLLVKEMKKTGALQDTRKLAQDFASKAIESISILEDSVYFQALQKLPKFVVERNK